MGKIDKIIGKFFDNLRKGRINSFTRDMLKDPEVRQSVKDYKQKEKELVDRIRKRHAENR
tara:strand:+ start:466 stop:645 length:180 start_codon:yes stop_codon:yes gene_type:complete